MKKTVIAAAVAASALLCHAQENTTLRFSYEHLDFDGSVKKDKGDRFGIQIDHQYDRHLFQAAYEKTDTQTFKPPLKQNLHVNKYYLKYTYALDEKQAWHISYATIDDNLMKETDGGHIFGAGYCYGSWDLTQYLSDYKHFNVYQTDLKYTYKKTFGAWKTATTLIGKYIHLQDRKSNPFSQNAKENYFTPGVKLHAHYGAYHMGAGAFFGKRIFGVMQNGFKVQHHAMEFEQTYMAGIGRHFGATDVTLRYVYQKATEVPVHNDDVKVDNLVLQLRYRF